MEDSEHTHKKAWFDLSLKGLFWPCSGEKRLGNRGGGGGSSEASDVSQAGWWRMERRWGALLLLFSFSVASDSLQPLDCVTHQAPLSMGFLRQA